MKLHWSPRSPYVRKVMIVAHELGLTDRIETMRTVVGGTTPHVALMRENPLGKIPTLVLEDGSVLYDSPVICEYLDTLHDAPKLFPSWPERLLALRRLALGDGMLDIASLGRRTVSADGKAECASHGAVGGEDTRVCRRARDRGRHAWRGCTDNWAYRRWRRAVVSGFPLRGPAVARRAQALGSLARHVQCTTIGGGRIGGR